MSCVYTHWDGFISVFFYTQPVAKLMSVCLCVYMRCLFYWKLITWVGFLLKTLQRLSHFYVCIQIFHELGDHYQYFDREITELYCKGGWLETTDECRLFRPLATTITTPRPKQWIIFFRWSWTSNVLNVQWSGREESWTLLSENENVCAVLNFLHMFVLFLIFKQVSLPGVLFKQ